MRKIMIIGLILVIIIVLVVSTLLFSINIFGGWNFMFLNKEYRNNIQEEAFLFNKDELIDYLNDDGLDDMITKLYAELSGKRLYLLIRLKNKGNARAWGELSCRDEIGYINYTLSIPSLQPNMDSWEYYIVYMGKKIFRIKDRPNLSLTWKKLYTK